MTKDVAYIGDKRIKDSVHGYITIEKDFLYVLDSAEFQRLKSIEQGSFRTVYPAARHDRFIHSLGVYYLADKFSENFIKNVKKDLGIKINKDECEKLLRTFRYAALLHDVGHAPFSHTSEGFFAEKSLSSYEYCQKAIEERLHHAIKKVVSDEPMKFFEEDFKDSSAPKPHEIISATILVERYDSFFPERKVEIDLELAARMVIGCTYDYRNYRNLCDKKSKEMLGIKNCLIRLLNSETVDVDKLDYIARDAQMSGFENVPIDMDRLCDSVTAVRKESDWIYPAFRKGALSVIDNVFKAKNEQGLWLISHPTVQYYSELSFAERTSFARYSSFSGLEIIL